jgi:UDP:flavonoid glycosyltransferase YjiC (YdhE family)
LYNQPDTAKRLERLGVARSIAPEKFTARRLITGIQELLDNSSVQSRCAELASKVDRPRGQRLTGDIVESLCGTDVVSRYEAAAQNNLFKPDLDSLATGCSS